MMQQHIKMISEDIWFGWLMRHYIAVYVQFVPDPHSVLLVHPSSSCLDHRFASIEDDIRQYVEGEGLHVVPQVCGHGIEHEFHTEPTVYHVDVNEPELVKPGTFFTIEPAIATSHAQIKIDKHDGQVRMSDGSLSAQFEHTVAVALDGQVHILTL
jgi:methionine aminopeptidase